MEKEDDNFFTWNCPEKHPTTHVQIGISTAGEVLAKWRCQGCAKEFVIRHTVADLIMISQTRRAAEKEMSSTQAKSSAEWTQEDDLLLKEMQRAIEKPNSPE